MDVQLSYSAAGVVVTLLTSLESLELLFLLTFTILN